MSRVTDSRSPTNGRELLGGDRKRERDADQGNRRERESSGSNAATTKRPRLAFGLGGGNRLFGLVNSTLNKAKVENEKKEKGEAAKQRADLEARLQKTTQKAPSAYSITPSIPSHILKNRTRLEEELRRDTIALQALVDRILTEENVHKSLKTQKRRLASFLVTKAPKDVGVRGRVIAPYVPGAIVPSPKSTSDPNLSSTRDSPTRTTVKEKKEDDSDSKEKEISTKSTIPDPSTYALYFLPKKLTPSQEDLLDEQEDKCDAELDRMDSQVERKVNDLKNNLERIKNRVKGKKKELEEIRKMEKEIKDREKEKRLKEEAERRKERDERKDGDEAGEKSLESDEKMEPKEVKDRDDRENDQSRSRSGSRSRSPSRDSKREGSLDREGYAEVN